jgi:3',5'-cyclic AMP phosphodiesterase CpdA
MHSHDGVELVLISGDLVEHGTQEQFGAIHDLLSGLPVPYYVVVGNHDYRTQTDRKNYEQLFRDRINYHFEHQGWQFVGFDTTDGMRAQNVSAPKSTLDWLDSTLPKLDKKTPTILFTHFPLGFGAPFILTNASDILERFKAFNVRAAYCGHYHGFTEKKSGNLVMTTDKCCSFNRANHDKTPEKGYFLCRAENGVVERTFIEVK